MSGFDVERLEQATIRARKPRDRHALMIVQSLPILEQPLHTSCARSPIRPIACVSEDLGREGGPTNPLLYRVQPDGLVSTDFL